MVVLRKTWGRRYKEALALLQKQKNPIAQYTLQVIKKKSLIIIPFNKIVKDDFKRYAKDYRNKKDEEIPSRFPPSKEVVTKFTRVWNAKINDNRVTINHEISEPKRIAEILAHEANHFLNKSNDHYHTVEQRFTEEFRAEVAEALVFSKSIRKWKLQKIANHVADRFELPHPETVEMPAGLFFP